MLKSIRLGYLHRSTRMCRFTMSKTLVPLFASALRLSKPSRKCLTPLREATLLHLSQPLTNAQLTRPIIWPETLQAFGFY